MFRKNIGLFFCILPIGGIIFFTSKKIKLIINDFQRNEDRLNIYYDILVRWMRGLYKKKNIISYLERRNIKSVAIYGLGKISYFLIKEIKSSNIELRYFINKFDNNEIFIEEDIYVSEIPPIINVDEVKNMTSVDAIIVTPVHDYTSIKEELKKVFDKEIISLENIINEIY